MTAQVTEGARTLRIAGAGDFTNNPNLGSLMMRIEGGARPVTLRTVLRGTTIYMTSDLFAGQLPGGARWLSLDLGKTGKALGVDIRALSSQAPASALEQLKASGKVKEIGHEELAGIFTTHYTAIIDTDKLEKLRKELRYEVSYAPVDVWIDERGLVRRIHLVTIAAAHGSVPETVTDMTLALSRYGRRVSVSVPSATETYDTTDLTESFLKKQ